VAVVGQRRRTALFPGIGLASRVRKNLSAWGMVSVEKGPVAFLRELVPAADQFGRSCFFSTRRTEYHEYRSSYASLPSSTLAGAVRSPPLRNYNSKLWEAGGGQPEEGRVDASRKKIREKLADAAKKFPSSRANKRAGGGGRGRKRKKGERYAAAHWRHHAFRSMI